MFSRGHDSCICDKNVITQKKKKKKYFTGQNLLILKNSHFAWFNSDAYCSLEVSFAGRNMAFLLESRPKNRPSRDCDNSNFQFFQLWRSSIKYAMCIHCLPICLLEWACKHTPVHDCTLKIWKFTFYKPLKKISVPLTNSWIRAWYSP